MSTKSRSYIALKTVRSNRTVSNFSQSSLRLRGLDRIFLDTASMSISFTALIATATKKWWHKYLGKSRASISLSAWRQWVPRYCGNIARLVTARKKPPVRSSVAVSWIPGSRSSTHLPWVFEKEEVVKCRRWQRTGSASWAAQCRSWGRYPWTPCAHWQLQPCLW